MARTTRWIKAVLNVFRMMGMLGGGESLTVTSSGAVPVDQILKDSVRGADNDVNAIATRDGRHVNVMLWNYHDDDMAAAVARVALEVKGLPAEKMKMQEFLVDSDAQQCLCGLVEDGEARATDCGAVSNVGKSGKIGVGEVLLLRWSRGTARVKLDVELERQAVMLVQLSW